VSSLSSVSFIQSLPVDKHALHDIRFRFRVDNIWTVISTNHPEFKPNDFSKDISLEPLETHDLTIKTTIHHTDTVSVIVACSLNPVAADLKGGGQTFQCINLCRGAIVTICRMRTPIAVTVIIRSGS
jgi:hypothetical protein